MPQNNKELHIPELSLVVLIGASGSGKSTFARQFFKPTEIVSSDACRGIVSDDENNQSASADAFELVRYIAAKRLKNGLLTVIDATNVQPESRRDWIKLAKEYHALPVAIVINMPEKICVERNEQRNDRKLGKHVVPQQISQLKKSIRDLRLEGFRHIFQLKSPEDVQQVEGIIREPLYNNKKEETGPFDIIGDVHGCYDELCLLLASLGYSIDKENGQLLNAPVTVGANDEISGVRKPVFVGDLVDRGPKSPQVLRLVMHMVKSGQAWCVPGNHDVKLLKWLSGKNVQLTHGLDKTVAQLSQESASFREDVKQFIEGLISHYVFDNGKLVVAHAGIKESMQGRGSGRVREFCLYGETTGETDEFGLPVRFNWAEEYQGKAMVVYGHTPVPAPQWLNHTIDVDTGCVFGGQLSALRYPEREIVSVPALEVYADAVRPIGYDTSSKLSVQQQYDYVLDINNFIGKRIVQTRYAHSITIREENSIAALEAMSRFAINPQWLIYLPPTMSPSETSQLPGLLEHPKEAFSYFRNAGVEKVVCEEKHMGSRAIVIVCKSEEVVLERFGIVNEGIGVVYTRTGRSFFSDKEMEQTFVQRINQALEKSGFYERFNTDWVCLDCELMPWSAKAQTLLEHQYASVGAAAMPALADSITALKAAHINNVPVEELLERYKIRHEQIGKYITAYRQYCWPVNNLDDYKLAPFHIMATAGNTWFEKDHVWHMEEIKQLCQADKGFLMATNYKVVDLANDESEQVATDWWTQLTTDGGEGMVVKPYTFISTNNKGLLQPAIKIRGAEYLRIIYGAEYDTPENITRLKSRGLSFKRSQALREFALGMEGLERFINKTPLQQIHECVFGILALESEPVDPRL